jgi:hypothetical protein
MNTFSQFGPGVDMGLEYRSRRRARELALVKAASRVSRSILRFGVSVMLPLLPLLPLLFLPPLIY